MKETILIDGKEVEINGEKNILELARKIGINIPTFCYHSELSIYGACRLCLVDVEGMGVVTSCSTPPRPGMKVKTNTEEIRGIRKINLELLLANHDRECTTCLKSGNCTLQDLSKKFGIDKLRYKPTEIAKPLDNSSFSLLRDPNKCILCGDCVRMCDEIQSVGAIDFAYRGSQAEVLPSFGKDLKDVECVNCGQCARVCPTGALMPKTNMDLVWKELDNKDKVVVAQVAPAIRVALAEYFGYEPGTVSTGKIIAALKLLGFDQVYDTSFSADLTVIEEGNEFIERFTENKNLPQFTSCCPAWVKFTEQYYPELLDNLSTCKSPQQMFGAISREILPELLNVDNSNLSLVSIMPCTAKKAEAKRPEFIHDNLAEVDHVLTTQELGRMIEQVGIVFSELEPESFDIPLGFNTGAGVIFGTSGGVTEAVLRYAVERVQNVKLLDPDFKDVRGNTGIKEAELELAGEKVKIAISYGLANARKLCEEAKNGKSPYALIEIMACPGGCVNGAGQPVSYQPDVIKKRGRSLYQVDKNLQLHKSQDNPYIKETYEKFLDNKIGGHKAHKLLHTHYVNRKRISKDGMLITNSNNKEAIDVSVCVGTSCYLKGSQDILRQVMHHVENNSLGDRVNVQASFCFENCGGAPMAKVGDKLINKCSADKIISLIDKKLD